ncbi:MAG: CRISPR-associated endonuclease Cas2 [Pseudomonadota bacterium]|nr:CRISPR-associated endonuclease Cas2 [Pseudomonadota bacterium]
MLVLITYDVSVVSEGGQRRLRNIAKTCLDYGVRVQNSVFECEVDPAQCVALKNSLLKLYNAKEDSLRFYYLNKKSRRNIEHFGKRCTPNPLHDTLIV